MAPKPRKTRLDVLLVERGLADDVGHARALVMAGQVVVDDQRRDKAGERYRSDCLLKLKSSKAGKSDGWASRGAHKLLGAVAEFAGFAEAIQGADCLDIGASTGGFTDVLLRQGAHQVISLDVGYGLLHWRLQTDPRVVVMDRTNIRHVQPGDLPFAPGVATCDASFISVTKFLPVVAQLVAPSGWFVVLVKPQFELPRDEVPEGGVVIDEEARQSALEAVKRSAQEAGFVVVGATDSPISGPKGNREFLLALRGSPGV